MAKKLTISGSLTFTVAATNAVYNEIVCNLAAIKMSAYNVQEQAVVFSFKKIDGDSQLALTAYPTLTVYNKSGVALFLLLPPADTSISYTIPVTDLATADRVMVRIYSDAARTKLLAQSAAISIVRENPMPFPRGESWTASMVFKNGEMLLLDNVAYMWSSPVSGNSTVDPKTDIATNAATTCWVAYQNWPLLCTNMMIARLALIGKAVFYDEFMFSQHGTDAAGNPSTNYQGFANGTFKPNILFNFVDGSGHVPGLSWDKYHNTFFRGSIFCPVVPLSYAVAGEVIRLDFSTGFNINISGLCAERLAVTLLLPDAKDYVGAECTLWFGHFCTRVPHVHPVIGIVNDGYFVNLSFEKKDVFKFEPRTCRKIKLSAMPVYVDNEIAKVCWYVDTPEDVIALE